MPAGRADDRVGSPATGKAIRLPSAWSPHARQVRERLGGGRPGNLRRTWRRARPVIASTARPRRAGPRAGCRRGSTALDLGQVVRGEEHGGAVLAELGDEAGELLLDERVQPGGRLVHDHERRAVHDRLDQPDLLPVPAGELADRPLQVRIEAPGERACEVAIADAAQLREEVQQLLPGRVARRRRTRPGGSRCAPARRRRRATCRSRRSRRCRRSGAAARAACGSSSSCRRRWGRGSRTPRRAPR